MSETWPLAAARMKCDKDWNGIELKFFAFDFDGTCTIEDTTSLYYKLTERYKTASKEDLKNFDNGWNELSWQYLTGYQDTVANAVAQYSVGDLLEFNEKGLRSLLASVDTFERKLTESVEASGLLKGITRNAIKEKAHSVKLSPACLSVLQQVKMTLHTISVNWSEDLIRAKLGHVKHLNILANNFPFKDDLSTGKIGSTINSAFDKEQAFKELCNCNEMPCGYSVYIGDAITDLLALLTADIGIVIGKSTTMRKVIKAFGITFQPLSDVPQLLSVNHCQRGDGLKHFRQGQRILYEANSWNEIGFSVLGSRYTPNKYE